jgi:lipoprotein-releasing system permease protein
VDALDSLEQLEYLVVYQRGLFSDNERIREAVTDGGIAHKQVFAQLPGVIRTKDQLEGIILKGVDTDFNWDFIRQYLVEGSILDLNSEKVSDGIIISNFTANRLKLEVGDQFIVYFVRGKQQIEKRLKVNGIYRTGLEDNDKKFALVDISKIQEILNWDANMVSGIEIFVDNLDDAEVIAEYLYIEELPSELYAQSIRRKFPNIFEWLDLQNINGVVILTLMVIVAVINMITVLLILILERTNMIGILKSLGAGNTSMRKIFLYHAFSIISVGLFWGNLIGLIICFLQQKFKFITLNEADYYLSYAPIDLNLFYVLMLNGATILITMLFLIIPTFLIARINPVKTIQFR